MAGPLAGAQPAPAYLPGSYPAPAQPAAGQPPADQSPPGQLLTGQPLPGFPGGGHPPDGQPAPGYPGAGHTTGEFPANGHPGTGPLPPVGPWIPAGARIVDYADTGDQPFTVRNQHLQVADPGRARSAGELPARGEDASWAMVAYLSVPFFGLVLPLVVYLIALRRSGWLRQHASQALNVWLTVLLYDLSAVIIGATLTLDSPMVAVAVVVPLAALLWLVTLAFLVRAAAAASRGETYTFPRWLCTIMAR